MNSITGHPPKGRNSGTTAFVGLTIHLALVLGSGCAKPIATEYYSRTPDTPTEWRLEKPTGQVIVGLAIDSPSLVAYGESSAAPRTINQAVEVARREACDTLLTQQAGAFLNYASTANAFGKIAFVTPTNVQGIDCQLELMLSFEHAGDSQVHYCLGRLIANIYDGAHAQLIGRVVKFHEAIYTSSKNNPDTTHDGIQVQNVLREKLFDELIDEFKSACDSDASEQESSASS